MLKLLPALLLVVLQGPSTAERPAFAKKLPQVLAKLAHSGRDLQAGLLALATQQSERDGDAEAMLASAPTGVRISQTLARAFLIAAGAILAKEATTALATSVSAPNPKSEIQNPKSNDPFLACRRTRDGPRSA